MHDLLCADMPVKSYPETHPEIQSINQTSVLSTHLEAYVLL